MYGNIYFTNLIIDYPLKLYYDISVRINLFTF